MSKAFTRESDDLPDRKAQSPLPSLLPPGVKNYLTSDGALCLREELSRLVEVERPKAAAAPDGSDAGRQLEILDQRIRHLQQCLHAAEIVPPPNPPWNQVRFGAVVTVRHGSGRESRYHIVGVGETNVEQNRVGWLSPIARALLNARLGQRVRFKFPSGEELLDIVNISYG
jgi:transcription elongation factor GreB